jgi:hypothetical protein
LYDDNGRILCDIEQRYPLKELSDLYESRRRKNDENQKSSWEDIKRRLRYPFGGTAIDNLFKRFAPGDPMWSRFTGLKSTKNNINSIINSLNINFRQEYISILTYVREKEDGKKLLRKEFGNTIELNEWDRGWSFRIDQEEIYNKFIEWLGL